MAAREEVSLMPRPHIDRATALRLFFVLLWVAVAVAAVALYLLNGS
jgi:hypothetical protein